MVTESSPPDDSEASRRDADLYTVDIDQAHLPGEWTDRHSKETPHPTSRDEIFEQRTQGVHLDLNCGLSQEKPQAARMDARFLDAARTLYGRNRYLLCCRH
jgi:hypothetical protein